jgi:proteasome lid subunit RPN8/RPN11
MVTMTQAVREAMMRHAEEAYPEECCGILLGARTGSEMRITEVVTTTNVATERRRRYEVDPGAIVRADRAARAGGKEIVGYYHSHPDHEPQPSKVDRELAWARYVYVIVEVNQGRAGRMHEWTAD